MILLYYYVIIVHRYKSIEVHLIACYPMLDVRYFSKQRSVTFNNEKAKLVALKQFSKNSKDSKIKN